MYSLRKRPSISYKSMIRGPELRHITKRSTSVREVYEDLYQVERIIAERKMSGMESVGKRKTQNVILDKKPRKTQKEYSKLYRDSLKNDPDLYRSYREVETARIKDYRENRQSSDAKQRNRDLQRLRQQKYRQKMKDQGKAPQVKPLTRHSQEVQRQKWREQKQKQRQNMSHQKRNAINAKRRKSRQEKKVLSPKPSTVDSAVGSTSTDLKSGALRTAKSRQKKKLSELFHMMPNNPNLKAAALTAAINEQSPRTKKCIEDSLGVESPGSKVKRKLAMDAHFSYSETLHQLRYKRSKTDIRRRRILAHAMNLKGKAVMQSLGISRKLRKRLMKSSSPGWEEERKKRIDALSENKVEEVKSFFDDVSKDIPNETGPIRVNGNMETRKIMESSIRSSYNRYKESVESPVSYGAFVRLKPKKVLPFTEHRFRECLCEYCLNIDLIIKALNVFCISHQIDCQIRDRYFASNLTICPKPDGGNYRKSCLDRGCERCGTQKIREHLQNILVDPHDTSPISWFQWESQSDGTSSRMMKVKKESVVEDLVEIFIVKMETFSVHLFNAKWQYDQYKNLIRQVPLQTVVFCMDYAENFTCKAQDAPQGFHWSNIHCTLHPIVCHYVCTDCEENPIVTDSIIFISDDMVHDHHGVQHFVGKAIRMLQDECNNTIQKVIQFSDGAPTQYKNKINFANCSFSNEDFGLVTDKNYFGSRHGKGPCDREIGVVKKSARAAIAASQETVLSPKDFYEFCRRNLNLPKTAEHSHLKRRFVYVDKRDVIRGDSERTKVRTLKNTRKLHCVRSVQPFVVNVRERTCYCWSCLGIVDLECSNKDVTGEWTVAKLKPNAAEKRRRREQPILENDDSLPNVEHNNQNDEVEQDGDIQPIPMQVEPDEDQSIRMPEQVEPEEDQSIRMPEQVEPDEDQSIHVGMPEQVEPDEDRSIRIPEQVEPDEDQSIRMPEQVEPDEDQSIRMPEQVEPDEDQHIRIPEHVEPDDDDQTKHMPVHVEKGEDNPDPYAHFPKTGLWDTDLFLQTEEDESMETDESFINIDHIMDLLSQESSVEPRFKVGEFVAVSLPVGKKLKSFVAEILEISEETEEVYLKYMQEKTGALYQWPSRVDTSLESFQSISKKLPFPVLSSKSTNERQLFEFNDFP